MIIKYLHKKEKNVIIKPSMSSYVGELSPIS